MKVVQGVVRKIQIVFRHDAKCTDDSQRAAVFTVELVDSIAINNQLPLIAPRQVEIAHQAFQRIVFIPVARVVHARPFVAAIPRVVFARITRRASDMAALRCLSAAVVSVVREDAQAVPARAGSGSAEPPVRFAAAISAWSFGTLAPGAWRDEA